MNEQKELSPRELQIAEFVAKGYQNQEIADRIGIARSTVDVHLGRTYAKLALRNRTELAMWWTEHEQEEA